MYLLSFYNDIQKVTDVFIQLAFEVTNIYKLLIIVCHRKIIAKLLQTIQANCDTSKGN